MKLAVIITTYNRPDALQAVLAGYAAQTDRDFDLYVADDGSREDTRKIVESWIPEFAGRLFHVWHEDIGFRAAAIRNRAIALTQAEYLVLTDGDCIPLTDFVERHRAHAQAGSFIASNRALLSQMFTERILTRTLPVQLWGFWHWVWARICRNVNRLLPLLRLPVAMAPLREINSWEGAKTCNLAVWRSDLLAVNGFEESYVGWGLEDSDLVIRLMRAGIKHLRLRLSVPVLHLWHKENDRGQLASNTAQLNELLASSRQRAKLGLEQAPSAH